MDGYMHQSPFKTLTFVYKQFFIQIVYEKLFFRILKTEPCFITISKPPRVLWCRTLDAGSGESDPTSEPLPNLMIRFVTEPTDEVG